LTNRPIFRDKYPQQGTGLKELKRLIRHARSKKFLTSTGEWATDFTSARRFVSMQEVIEASRRHNLEDIEVFLMMGDSPSQYDVVLPLRKPDESAGLSHSKEQQNTDSMG
jgi:hypothetical protein